MSELYDLLDRVAGDGDPSPVTERLVDDDLARGRRALRTHRLRRGATGLSAVAAIAVLSFGVPAVLSASAPSGATPGGSAATDGSGPAPSTSSATPGPVSVTVEASAPPGPELVAADPTAVARLAIRPALVPKGWSVDGSAAALVISPPGITTVADDFEGKLVVMLADTLPAAPDGGYATADIGGTKAFVVKDGGVLHAWVRQDDGRYLEVQAPLSAEIDELWLGRFLAGVTVTSQARAALG